MLDPTSFLFITLDSCRYDTFLAAAAPNLKNLAPLHRAIAPGYFTYASHAAMFMGFTPGVASAREPFINPKYGKVFRLVGGGFLNKGTVFVTLRGRNIIDGLNRLGYLTLGTGAVGWLNPRTPTGRSLTGDFHRYYFPGNSYSLAKQLAWVQKQLRRVGRRPVFLFINVGETHVPYYYHGAPWSPLSNPCIPFGDHNDAAECRRRQTACLEFVDAKLAPLLEQFDHANILVCSDHGDAWGEDGLWEHGVYHPTVMEVPLLLRLNRPPPSAPAADPAALPWWRRLAHRMKHTLD
ncbi:MAG: hypothetical protein ACE5HL_08130 [Terriglobia bacterium]